MARSYCPNLWPAKMPHNQKKKFSQSIGRLRPLEFYNLENLLPKWNIPSQTSAPLVKRHQRARTGRCHPRVKFTWRFTGARSYPLPFIAINLLHFLSPCNLWAGVYTHLKREGEAQQPQSLSGTPGAESNITSPTHHPPTTTKQRNKWCPKSRSSRQKSARQQQLPLK